MPRATAADAALTAARILDTADELFAAKGYAAVSLDEVARRAGVTRGAVYHHYAGREGLFAAVVQRAQQKVAARIVSSADAQASPEAQLRAGCHAFLDAITEGATARLLLVDAPAVLGWSAWREADAAASGRELKEALAAIPAIAVSEREALAQLLSGAMNEAALWIAEESSATARGAAHAALDRLLDAVAPGSRAVSPATRD